MVNSVSNAASASIARTQTAQISAGVAALKSGNQATQQLITQLQKPSATPAPKIIGSSGALPRGSLVDITA